MSLHNTINFMCVWGGILLSNGSSYWRKIDVLVFQKTAKCHDMSYFTYSYTEVVKRFADHESRRLVILIVG